MKVILAVIVLAISAPSLPQQSEVSVTFSPESKKFAEATKQYQTIWNAEGKIIIQVMENISGLRFREKEIRVIIFEGISRSGSSDSPMKLRASYPADVKKAALIHELGHRLNFQLTRRPKELDNHKILYLYLYDVWVKLYGQRFADEQVEVEKRRTLPVPFRWLVGYDYRSAWEWALRLSAEERASKFREVVRKNEEAQGQKK